MWSETSPGVIVVLLNYESNMSSFQFLWSKINRKVLYSILSKSKKNNHKFWEKWPARDLKLSIRSDQLPHIKLTVFFMLLTGKKNSSLICTHN